MVEFDLVAAVTGGLAATIVMSAMMTMAKSAGLTDMPPMPVVTGSMMSGDRKTALGIGTMIHYLIMGTVVFGIIYGALFTAFDDTSWWIGAAIGGIHGLIVGAMFMPMMPSMHPRMFHPDGPSAGPADTTSADGDVRVMLARSGRPANGVDDLRDVDLEDRASVGTDVLAAGQREPFDRSGIGIDDDEFVDAVVGVEVELVPGGVVG